MAQRMHDWGEAHPDEQVQFVSLSAAPLSGLQHSSDATSDDTSNIDGTTVLQHSLALVADLLEPAYGFKSLYRFKLKFQPIQRPVYICYRDSALLPNLAIAIIRAYLPSLTFREALGMLVVQTEGRCACIGGFAVIRTGGIIRAFARIRAVRLSAGGAALRAQPEHFERVRFDREPVLLGDRAQPCLARRVDLHGPAARDADQMVVVAFITAQAEHLLAVHAHGVRLAAVGHRVEAAVDGGE